MANTRKGSEKNKTLSDKSYDTAGSSDQTLAAIRSDLREIKENLQKTVKTCDLESMVTNIVTGLLKSYEKEAEKRETQLKQKIDRLTTDIDKLTMENETLREKICEANKNNRDLQKEMNEGRDFATFSTVKSNYNEQYSRKNNIKIYGIPETKRDNIVEIVKSTLKKKGCVEVDHRDIEAVHRIPGSRPNAPRPILMKMRNNDKKANIMRYRSAVKDSPVNVRLGDDVTKENRELIVRLLDHESITSAWYFNGSVYGNIKGKRVKFDILDDIDFKVKKIRE
ncbi:uncharacterized protein LOC130054887 [Ostrea edulis]|uniref:uncharacterized protein LOC130054887 n=1 Tax=Ostrea edulis TaxID=37623 RepID=UPI0024AEE66E|nr:uncharacterized protein LOC130054887 [Ostrea edulis]